MATIRRKGRRWHIRRYVGGRQVEEALGTTSARRARKILEQYEAKRSLGIDPPARSKTRLAGFLEEYTRHLRLTLGSEKSVKNDVSRLVCFFREVSVDTLEALTPALIHRTIELKRARDGISPKTCNHYREILHRTLEYARRICGFVSPDPRYPNPVDAVRKCAEPAPRIFYMELDEIDGLLTHLAPHAALQAATATLVYAGLRRSELLWLTTEDVDTRSRLVMVRSKMVEGEAWEPKTRKNRSVPLSESLLQYLELWLRVRPESVWLFPARRGGRWDADNFSSALRGAQAGREKVRTCLHFRHTFASHLARKGVSIFKIAKLLGNTAQICERHYAFLSPAGLADEVEFGGREARLRIHTPKGARAVAGSRASV